MWCNGDDGRNDGPIVVQELMAAQLATTLSGFTGNLFQDQQEMVEDAQSDRMAAWKQAYLAPSGGSKRPSHHANAVLIIVAVLCFIAFAGTGAFAVYQHRKHRSTSIGQEGYIPLNTVNRQDA